MNDQLLDSANAAAVIGCSTRTLARLVAERRIGYVRWGAGRRRQRIGFTPRHIEAFLLSCEVLAETPPEYRSHPTGSRLAARVTACR